MTILAKPISSEALPCHCRSAPPLWLAGLPYVFLLLTHDTCLHLCSSMTKILGRVHDGDTSTTAISHESLLEASELLQDNLGSSELTSRTIQWDNFPALMKLWEVLWQAQASLVQEADRLLELVDDLSQQEARLAEIKADLEEIKVGKREERDRHFALALYWRRHVSVGSS